MEYEVIRKDSLTPSEWSGGTTTEIAIYPRSSRYIDRQFDYRISTAHVEVEESKFTSLPGYDRILMCLEGKVGLIHKGHHTSQLLPMDADEFKGDWETMSQGTCTDFNLIFDQNLHGAMARIKCNQNLLVDFVGGHFYIYSPFDRVTVALADHDVILNGGDALFLPLGDLAMSEVIMKIESQLPSNVIACHVKLDKSSKMKDVAVL